MKKGFSAAGGKTMLRDRLPNDGELVFDVEGTLTRYGGSKDLLVDMIGFFREDAPKLLESLRRAAAERDAVAVRNSAHALKGLLAGCGGERAAQAAQRVENAGATSTLTDIAALIDALDTQIDLLRNATAQYCS